MRTTAAKGFSKLRLVIGLVVIIVVAVGLFLWLRPAKTSDSATGTPAGSSLKAQSSTPTITNAVPPTNPDATKYSKVPSDLQAAIVAADQSREAACVKNGAPVTSGGVAADPDVKYDARGFAELALPSCDDGSANLFVKVSGAWQDVAQTQSAFNCSLLTQYKVPSAIVQAGDAAQCFDASNNEIAYSQS